MKWETSVKKKRKKENGAEHCEKSVKMEKKT